MSYQTPEPFYREARKGLLAQTIAEALRNAEHLHKYIVCCRKYPLASIMKALVDAKAFPQERIKKSRAAVFFYFVKQYARNTPNHSGH